jgi:hypothetical protein
VICYAGINTVDQKGQGMEQGNIFIGIDIGGTKTAVSAGGEGGAIFEKKSLSHGQESQNRPWKYFQGNRNSH